MSFSEPIQALDAMIEKFDAQAAEGLNAIYQWEVVGEDGGVWHITVADGTAQLSAERHDSPTVSQICSTELFLAMVNMEVDGMQAFMSGQLKMTGDMMAAQKIMEIFPL